MRGFHPKQPCVYLLASAPNGVLYAGVTSNVAQRASLHEQKLVDGFTKRYGVTRLVYYEMHATMDDAIRRESQIKKWKRAWKVRLILQTNPEWADLFDQATGEVFPLPADVERERG
ncbi:MAG: GIY-YIG nuclease family protein [Hyphomicrobium sp.]